MRPVELVKLYLYTVPIFFAVDMVWLGWIAPEFYQSNLGHLLAPQVNWPPAILFYLSFIAGILFFAVVPGLRERSLRKTLISGLAFGYFTYATYELTNMATLSSWPLVVVVADIAWGMTLCGVVACLSWLIGRRLMNRVS